MSFKKFENAVLVGANTVYEPSPSKVETRSARSNASNNVENCGALEAIAAILLFSGTLFVLSSSSEHDYNNAIGVNTNTNNLINFVMFFIVFVFFV